MESSAHLDALVEDLKSSGGFCIIPHSTLEMILLDNKHLRTETHELNVKVTTAIERVTEAIEKFSTGFVNNSTQQTNNSNELYQRLDSLIEKVSMNNSLSSTPPEVTDIESELRKRKEQTEKLIRNEELSNYFESLLGEPQPFVRREFRTHVNKNTSERELVHRRQQSIDKVNTEIKIMRDRVNEHTEKKTAIDQKIQEHLALHEDARTDIEQKMTFQDKSLRETFQRNSLTKMKESDNQEKMNSFEYLVKYTDSSLNSRGSHSRPSNRRPFRKNRGGHQPAYWTSAPLLCLVLKLSYYAKGYRSAQHLGILILILVKIYSIFPVNFV